MFVDRIFLRALSKNDAEISWKWRNTEDVREYYSGHPFYITQEDEEAWIEKISGSNFPLTCFGIEEKSTNNLIGMTFLKDINLINRACEFAIFIGDKNAKGKGYAKEATLKTIKFAFNDLNLNRVFLIVQEDNIPAKKLYEKCGFRMEGQLRESVYKNGKYKDEIIMSVLRKDFTNFQENRFVDFTKIKLKMSNS